MRLLLAVHICELSAKVGSRNSGNVCCGVACWKGRSTRGVAHSSAVFA
jgi:hypothetical protein